MAETHELRLKINAAAARSGAKEFRAAINSIKAAVSDLDKTTSGVFSRFDAKARGSLKGTTSETTRYAKSTQTAADAVKRMALSSAGALRTSQNEVAALSKRLSSLGATDGIDNLNRELVRLKNNLTNASTPLDVRAARSRFADSSSEARRYATTLEATQRAENESANSAKRLANARETLKQKYIPLYAESQRYEQALREINNAESQGILTSQQAANARQNAALQLQNGGNQMRAFGKTAQVSTFHTANMAAQFNDIGVMLASGQSPLLLAVQQGTQISQVLNQIGGRASVLSTLKSGFLSIVSPISLVTVGAIALGAAIVQGMMRAVPETLTLADAMDNLNESIDAAQTSASKTDDLAAMRKEYGLVTTELIALLEVRKQLDQLDASNDLRTARDTLFGESAGVSWMESLAGYANTAGGRARRLRDELELTKQAAIDLEAIWSKSNATNDAGELADLYAQMRETIIDSVGGVKNLTGAQSQHVRELTNAEDAARRLDGIISGAIGQTNAWASAMSGVRMEINAILSSLASIGGGVLSNAAKGAELSALNAGKGVKAAAVERERFMFNQEMSAKEMRANATGGVAGWAQRQLIEAEKYQFEESLRLDSSLDAAREKARKAAKASAGGGGGKSKRVEALGDETRQLQKLIKKMNNRTFALDQENAALEILIAGQTETLEGAKLLAAAQAQGAAATDEQTLAMVRQYDQASKLNDQLKRLAKEPVKDWIASVPNWRDASQEIQVSALDALSDSIANLAKTGKLNIETLGAAILDTAIDVISDMAVKELVSMLGLSGGGAAASGGGGFLSAIFGGFSEGGISTSPVTSHAMPVSAFHHAPSYASGTPNTSLGGAIPAILHDNEAVVPLSGGRKIPVEMGGQVGGGGNVVNQTMNFYTPDADSFRKSQDQISAAMARSGQRALQKNG